ncbi:NAD(P)H-binding protein [Amycolatopsis sp. OK19-0408]|uniref:NAD(P)H-binding protein n=1 Tax=Amycolatopsis iheyensis TaxID=2945988 RepID=A0A9X2NJ50_9PSEU|nr:NAD(P)H-binding protein [Amycolatopsis iheyensis]MCR6488787.1 NAD(P)H-binding protein [Amycolatopsis iheyensis]
MPVLVIGAYGNVGSQVAAGLVAAGAEVRGTSRTPKPGGGPEGVEVVRLDLGEPASLPAALEGVEKVFLYANPERIGDFVGAAEKAGVQHVVLLSSTAVVEPAARNSRAGQLHAAVEEALQASGLGWTFLRPTTFASKQLHWGPKVRAGEVLRIPFLQVRTATIHERDIADVAVRALTGEGHEGQAYWLTGPQALSQQEHIEAIGAAVGREIEVVDLAPEDAEPKLPEFYVRAMTAALGAEVVVTSTVEEVTGKPARSFREWAQDHVEAFS